MWELNCGQFCDTVIPVEPSALIVHALKKAGAQEGDVVRIGGYELEYQE
ncbi:MAG: hypothetical protein FD146_2488 [Anaerolineaceae bacterium]|nr:MAG: hypothetical protein FD146_2488 [Anaerolineaceae bacterium]